MLKTSGARSILRTVLTRPESEAQNSAMQGKRRTSKGITKVVSDSVDPSGPAVRVSRFGRLMEKIKRLKGVVAAVAGVGALVGGLSGYWNAYQTTKAAQSSLLAMVGSGTAGPLSIVVLPFANLTGDAQQSYLADGLTAAMTTDLSRIRDAFVVNATTAHSYKGKSLTTTQIGRELGVRFALHGSVQRDRDTVRVQAQLADTASNAQIWSEVFDGSLESLFALQDLVTSRVGNSIGREMVISAARDSERRKSDPKAADLMLRARALKVGPVSAKLFQEQAALFRQVLLLEPESVQAVVGLSVALASAVDSGFIADPVASEAQLTQAHELALKAKAIDPNIADIYFTLSYYALIHGDWSELRRSEQTALKLEPKNPLRYNASAAYSFYAGEPDRAIKLLGQAINLDPKHVSEQILLNMGRALFMQGEDDAAIEWLLKCVDVNPSWALSRAYLAAAYASKGDLPRSQDAVAAMRNVDSNFSLYSFEEPTAKFPARYQKYWETRLLPSIRTAKLP